MNIGIKTRETSQAFRPHSGDRLPSQGQGILLNHTRAQVSFWPLEPPSLRQTAMATRATRPRAIAAPAPRHRGELGEAKEAVEFGQALGGHRRAGVVI